MAKWLVCNWASASVALAWAGAVGLKRSWRRLRGDKGRSGTHERCGPGWLALDRILVFRLRASGLEFDRDLALDFRFQTSLRTFLS